MKRRRGGHSERAERYTRYRTSILEYYDEILSRGGGEERRWVVNGDAK